MIDQVMCSTKKAPCLEVVTPWNRRGLRRATEGVMALWWGGQFVPVNLCILPFSPQCLGQCLGWRNWEGLQVADDVQDKEGPYKLRRPAAVSCSASPVLTENTKEHRHPQLLQSLMQDWLPKLRAESVGNVSSQLGMTRNMRTANVEKDKNKKLS